MRKIIQIAVTGHENTPRTQSNMSLIALCDDGTLWTTTEHFKEWLICSCIPQGDPYNAKPTRESTANA